MGAGLLTGLGGCSNKAGVFQNTEGQWFSKPFARFSREDGSSAALTDKNFQLTPTGPVPAEELVQPDGRCAAQAAQVAAQVTAPAPQSAAAKPAADRAVGSVAGDLAGAPMPAGPAPTPASSPPDGQPGLDPGAPLLGGVALGMSECETVRRAGPPSNVNIGLGDNGDRKVVLTYLEGSWPGIYTFMSGRLKDISAAPVQPKKPVAKKKPTKRVARPKAPTNAAPPTQIR
jgi:hypothetical protein